MLSSTLSSMLAVALVIAGLAVTWSALLWDRVPAWFVEPPRPSSWAMAEAFRFAAAFLLLAPATAAFAALPAFCARGRAFAAAQPASSWAFVVAGVAVGGGVGAVVTSSSLLAAFGGRGVLTLAALHLFVLASIVAALARGESRANTGNPGNDVVGIWASSVALSTVAVLLPGWDDNALLQADATRFRAAFTTEKSRIVAHAEDSDGIVTVVRKTPGKKKRAAGHKSVVTVLHDGVVVGDDARRARDEARRAALAIASARQRPRAFVSDIGSGRAVATFVAANIVDVDVVASSHALVETVRAQLKRAHRGALDRTGVRVIVDDASAALARSTERYGVIVVDAPALSSARTAAFVSRGFFAAARARLVDGGALSLSFPLGGAVPEDVAAVVVTARSVFHAVEMFVVADRAVVVATDHLPEDLGPRFAALGSTPAFTRLLEPPFDAPSARALSTVDVDLLATHHAGFVVDDGAAFGVRAARAAWTAAGPRRTLDGVWGLLPADVAAARRPRLDELLPPRARRPKAPATTPPPTTTPTTTPPPPPPPPTTPAP
jgi:spermidine synthase